VRTRLGRTPGRGEQPVHLGLVAIVVAEYDPAISFFVRMTSAGVRFITPPRTESYGRVAVFLDIAGNKWDLLGPA
jgi:hypothetical protein